ncbi:hypothetical protein K438DRAFT_1972257 [Mycena galopus ATCC 62051]|nr:hypothetical protein K438DRAFT_1972257 [Mycena galopus ATCC 62051]
MLVERSCPRCKGWLDGRKECGTFSSDLPLALCANKGDHDHSLILLQDGEGTRPIRVRARGVAHLGNGLPRSRCRLGLVSVPPQEFADEVARRYHGVYSAWHPPPNTSAGLEHSVRCVCLYARWEDSRVPERLPLVRSTRRCPSHSRFIEPKRRSSANFLRALIDTGNPSSRYALDLPPTYIQATNPRPSTSSASFSASHPAVPLRVSYSSLHLDPQPTRLGFDLPVHTPTAYKATTGRDNMGNGKSPFSVPLILQLIGLVRLFLSAVLSSLQLLPDCTHLRVILTISRNSPPALDETQPSLTSRLFSQIRHNELDSCPRSIRICLLGVYSTSPRGRLAVAVFCGYSGFRTPLRVPPRSLHLPFSISSDLTDLISSAHPPLAAPLLISSLVHPLARYSPPNTPSGARSYTQARSEATKEMARKEIARPSAWRVANRSRVSLFLFSLRAPLQTSISLVIGGSSYLSQLSVFPTEFPVF